MKSHLNCRRSKNGQKFQLILRHINICVAKKRLEFLCRQSIASFVSLFVSMCVLANSMSHPQTLKSPVLIAILSCRPKCSMNFPTRTRFDKFDGYFFQHNQLDRETNIFLKHRNNNINKTLNVKTRK